MIIFMLQLDDYWFTSSQVLYKEKLDDGVDCMDSNNNTYSHLQTWAEQGVCSTVTCFQVCANSVIYKFREVLI